MHPDMRVWCGLPRAGGPLPLPPRLHPGGGCTFSLLGPPPLGESLPLWRDEKKRIKKTRYRDIREKTHLVPLLGSRDNAERCIVSYRGSLCLNQCHCNTGETATLFILVPIYFNVPMFRTTNHRVFL